MPELGTRPFIDEATSVKGKYVWDMSGSLAYVLIRVQVGTGCGRWPPSSPC